MCICDGFWQIRSHLTIVESEFTKLMPTIHTASTKKIEKQRSFILKKKDERCKVKFRNPPLDQRRKIKNTLLSKEIDTISMKDIVWKYGVIVIIYILLCRFTIKPFVYNAN